MMKYQEKKKNFASLNAIFINRGLALRHKVLANLCINTINIYLNHLPSGNLIVHDDASKIVLSIMKFYKKLHYFRYIGIRPLADYRPLASFIVNH